MNYALTAIRSARGEETPCFSANVTFNGVIIGTVRNSGTGGCCDWHWKDRLIGDTFTAWIKANTTEEFEPEDDWAYAQLDKFEEAKLYMRKSLKKVLFRLTGDEADSYRELNTTDIEKAKAFVVGKYAALKPVIFDRLTKNWVAA